MPASGCSRRDDHRRGTGEYSGRRTMLEHENLKALQASEKRRRVLSPMNLKRRSKCRDGHFDDCGTMGFLSLL